VRGVVFDLDGTLIDSYAAITASLNRARDAFGLAALDAEEVRSRVGHDLEGMLADLLGPQRVSVGVCLFREHYARVCLEQTTALHGSRRVLEALDREGLALSVASNKPVRFGEPILRHLGLLRFVSVVEGPDSSGAAKPDPRMIRRCLERTGLRSDESLYVGDAVLDDETARRAGIAAVLVSAGSSPREALLDTGRLVVDSLLELPGLLRNCRNGLTASGDCSAMIGV